MLKKACYAISLFFFLSSSHARGFDIKLAEKVAEFTYLTESSTFGYGGADIGFGVLFTENDDYQINANIMISGNPAGNNKALQYGVGGKVTFITIDVANEEVGALALAGQIRYIIPSQTPVAFVASLAYAPGITSFSGADNFTEYSFVVELEVTPSARAYIGYRKIEYELETGFDFKVDNGAHIGVKFEF